MRDLTLQIVAKSLFDIETSDVVRRVGEAFAETEGYIYARLTQPLFLRQLLHRLPVPSTRRFKAARAYLDELIYGLIKDRRQQGAEGDDLLCMLLQARYEDAGERGRQWNERRAGARRGSLLVHRWARHHGDDPGVRVLPSVPEP